MVNALISAESLPACERLLELCEVEYDNPVCGIMKAHLQLLVNDITNPLLQFKAFNDLLDTCVGVERMPESERPRIRSLAINAITTFVWVAHMQLECARKKAQKLETDVLRDVTRKAIAGTKLACKLYCDHITGGAVSVAERLECVMEDSQALQRQEIQDEPPRKIGLIDKIINFFKQEEVVERSENDFFKLVSNVMAKLDRYADRIGASISIAEMIRDYAGWMYEMELRSLRSPWRPSPPKEVTADFSKAKELAKKILLPVGGVFMLCFCFNIFLGFAMRVLLVVLAVVLPIIVYHIIVERNRIAHEKIKYQEAMRVYKDDMKVYNEKRLPAFEAKKDAVKVRYNSRLAIADKFDA